MNINLKCSIPQSVLEIRGAQLNKLTRDKLYDAMNNGRSFDLKEYMTWVFNQKTAGKPGKEEDALTYLRMIPRFIKRTLDDPGHWELRTYFRDKGLDLNDLTDLALRVEDNNTGLKSVIDFLGFDKNRQEELEQYLPDRTNPVDQEELSYAREAFNLFGNLDTFNPSPSSTLIDVDFETFLDKYDTKKETGVKKPTMAFYYTVKRAILNAIFSDFNGSDSSQIDYPKVGPVFLKVIDSRKIKDYPGKLRDEDPENFDPKAFKVLNLLKGKDAKAAHARIIRDFYARDLAELTELASGNADEQLKEGYKHRSRKQIKNFIAFLQEIESACNMLMQEAKVNRKPRKTKAVSKDKVVSKLKYKKTEEALKLVSVNPVDIIGSKELWIYNTKTRKLGKYVASEFNELGIKGTTITGFNETESICKTLRKPDEKLKEFKAAGKVALRKFLDDINATDTKMNGRINEETILLKVQ